MEPSPEVKVPAQLFVSCTTYPENTGIGPATWGAADSGAHVQPRHGDEGARAGLGEAVALDDRRAHGDLHG